MVSLSKRERNLAIGAGSALGAILLYFVVLSPLVEQWDTLARDRTANDQKKADARLVFEKQIKLKKVWDRMLATGLRTDTSLAESQAENAAYRLAGKAGVTDISLKTERPSIEGSFQVTGFSLEGIGSMRQLSELVYLMETASIPLYVTDLQITPVPEGSDHLKVHLAFSTLCVLAPEKTAAKGARS